MCLILQITRFQFQVLKPCKSVQELSEESAIHLNSIASIYRGLKVAEVHGSTANSIDDYL